MWKAIAFSFVAAAVVLAQPQVARPTFDAFEVATIKPTPPDWNGGRFIRMQTAHQLVARNHSIKTLLAAAYNLSPQAIFGVPEWGDSEHYDILAQVPGEVRPNLDEQMAMLRKLLTDRFGLVFHRERREMPVYALTVAKNGVQLKPTKIADDVTPQGPPALVFVIAPDGVSLPAVSATVGEFASVLQRAAMNRPVVDQTGLTGRYDFLLDFLPDETQFGGLGIKPNPDRPKPDLFAAVQQQLGLRLEATKGVVDTLVVDRYGKPSEN